MVIDLIRAHLKAELLKDNIERVGNEGLVAHEVKLSAVDNRSQGSQCSHKPHLYNQCIQFRHDYYNR